MNKQDIKDKWDNDPEYRVKVLRELEASGTIQKLPPAEFGLLAHAEKVE